MATTLRRSLIESTGQAPVSAVLSLDSGATSRDLEIFDSVLLFSTLLFRGQSKGPREIRKRMRFADAFVNRLPTCSECRPSSRIDSLNRSLGSLPLS